MFGYLGEDGQSFEFSMCFLLFLPGTTFTEYGKILFLRILQDFELFLGVCIESIFLSRVKGRGFHVEGRVPCRG